MSVDKLVDSTQLDADLTSVANAIRAKGGTSASLAFPAEFVSAIQAIPTGGGPAPARLIDYAEVTLATTANSNNKLTVNLTPVTDCCIVVCIDTLPSAPDSSVMIALRWANLLVSYGNYGNLTDGRGLRTNGTIGTDGAMCSFNRSTGVFQLGGQYANFLAGTTYHIYEFEIGAA